MEPPESLGAPVPTAPPPGHVCARCTVPGSSGSVELIAGVPFCHACAANLPEVPQLERIAVFYRGAAFLQADRSSEALTALRRARRMTPPGDKDEVAAIDRLILQAELGAAFDGKEYAVFLQKALEAQKADPQSATATAQVASAYACLFAVSGDEELKRKAEEYLGQARQKLTKEEAASSRE
jgi:hypothetical protein